MKNRLVFIGILLCGLGISHMANAKTVTFTENFNAGSVIANESFGVSVADGLRYANVPQVSPRFTAPRALSSLANTQKIHVLDADGDGWTDVLFINVENNAVLWRNDNGVLQRHSQTDFNHIIYDTAVADIDGDGDTDLVLASPLALRFYLNDGTGAFSQNQDDMPLIALSGRVRHLAVADLNGDGYHDIVIAEDNQPVKIFANAPAPMSATRRTFQLVRTANSAQTNRFALYLFDINNDFALDAVSANFNQSNTALLTQNSSPLTSAFANTFVNGIIAPETAPSASQDVAIADFTSDGLVDIWEANLGDNALFVQQTSGTFAAQVLPNEVINGAGSANNSQQVLAWDFDRDGDFDIIERLDGANSPIALWQNKGLGNALIQFDRFANSSSTPDLNTQPHDMALADINRDGQLDLITAHNGDNTLWINSAETHTSTAQSLTAWTQSPNIFQHINPTPNAPAMQISTIRFEPHGISPLNTLSFAISVDGGEHYLSLAPEQTLIFTPSVSTQDIRWQLNAQAHSPHVSQIMSAFTVIFTDNSQNSTAPIKTVQAGAFPLVAGFMLWLILATRLPFTKKQNSRTRLFTVFPLVLLAVSLTPLTLSIAQPFSDVVTPDMPLTDSSLFIDNPLLAQAGFITAVSHGDFDGDGDTDLVIANRGQPAQVLLNINDNSRYYGLIPTATLPLDDVIALATGDLNNDGNDAIISVNNLTVEAFSLPLDTISLPNNSLTNPVTNTTSWQHRILYTAALAATDMAVADMDNNGELDIVIASANNPPSILWQNNGQFTRQTLGTAIYHTTTLALADVNADGVVDIILGNSNGADGILYRDALATSATFTFAPLPDSEHASHAIAVTDANNDQRPDLLITHTDGVSLYVQSPSSSTATWTTHALSTTAYTANTQPLTHRYQSETCALGVAFAQNGSPDFVRPFLPLPQWASQSPTPTSSILAPAVIPLTHDAKNSVAVLSHDFDHDGDDDLISLAPTYLHLLTSQVGQFSQLSCGNFNDITADKSTLTTPDEISNLVLEHNGNSCPSCDVYVTAGSTLSVSFSREALISETDAPALVLFERSPINAERVNNSSHYRLHYTVPNTRSDGAIPIRFYRGIFGAFTRPAFSIIVDNTAPPMPVLEQAISQFPASLQTLTLTAYSSEADSLLFHGAQGEERIFTQTATLDNAGVGSATLNAAMFSYDIPLILSVTAIDKAGNSSAPYTWTVTRQRPQQQPIKTASAGALSGYWVFILCVLWLLTTRSRLPTKQTPTK